jgi:hypothetical protein
MKPVKVQCCQGRPYELPDGFDIVCSADWRFSGPADGCDLWDRWTVTGPGDPKDSFVRPWLDHRIIVVGYEMVKLSGPPHQFFGIGSGIQPDMFLWMGSTESRAKTMFPKGLGHPWPSAEDAAKPGFNNMIDIHGSARTSRPGPVKRFHRMLRGIKTPPFDPVQVELTIYYTPWT